jgi:hypothetical protein
MTYSCHRTLLFLSVNHLDFVLGQRLTWLRDNLEAEKQKTMEINYLEPNAENNCRYV